MPKMKTQRGAAKRFRRTASGKLKRYKAYRTHLLSGMTPKRKRQLRKSGLVSKADSKRINRMLPN